MKIEGWILILVGLVMTAITIKYEGKIWFLVSIPTIMIGLFLARGFKDKVKIHSQHPRIKQDRGGEFKPEGACANSDNDSPADTNSQDSSKGTSGVPNEGSNIRSDIHPDANDYSQKMPASNIRSGKQGDSNTLSSDTNSQRKKDDDDAQKCALSGDTTVTGGRQKRLSTCPTNGVNHADDIPKHNNKRTGGNKDE